ncbi:MAG TPA: MerR family transcriptional regulator [Patescibacteria group bacterium]|nr:MerR family transcriptional regulator [Patescibacteria group bacterium]
MKEQKIRNIYLIKDLARATGYSIYTLKYYLNLGLIKEFGRSPETGYRYFDDATVDRLKKIRVLRREGKSIKTILHELL